MAITSLDSYIASTKQKIPFVKTIGTSVCVAAQWHSLYNEIGVPGKSALSALHTTTSASTAGRVPTQATAGFPSIFPFSSGATGYLTGFDYAANLSGRYMVYDRIWEAGPFCSSTGVGFGASSTLTYNLTLNDPCLYQYRVPTKSGGTAAWETLELWAEVSTAMPATAATLTVTYVNETSTGNRTTTSPSLSAYITGRTFQLPLMAGDKGIIKVTDVSFGGTQSAATGVLNVYLARPLYTGARVNVANYSDAHSFEKLGMPIISSSCAFALNYAADAAIVPVIDCLIEIANG